MKLKSLFAATAVALAAAGTPVAHADAVATFQGVTFTYHVVDADTFTLRIEGLLDATGNWGTATHVMALQFSGTGADVHGATINPDGDFFEGGLNANACNGNVNANGFCFNLDPRVASDNDDLFTIDLTNFTGSLLLNSNPHLKVNFGGATGGKIGSNYSDNLEFQSSSSSSTSSSGLASSSSSSSSSSSGVSTSTGRTISEPTSTSMALLGLGMLAGGFLLRRRNAHRS